MTTPPDPEFPTVRCRLDYTQLDGALGGSRFYLQMATGGPTGANCTTLAGDIESAWASHLAPLITADWALTEVDVLDITTNTGASGYWTGSTAATRSGAAVPANCATNVEFNISQRYRGGKPRMYLPPGADADLLNTRQWGSSFVTAVNSGMGAFFTALEGLSIGSIGALSHVVLSYYHGWNTNTPPWRGPGYKYPPKYRTQAIPYAVAGYACKAVVGSQRRRRTAATY
jgi:hypothetical protein